MRALLLLLAACNGTMESFFGQDIAILHEDIKYVDGTDNPRQSLDLVLPRSVYGFPTVVFVHGGFWIHQGKDYFQPVVGLYRNVGFALARHGIGAAIIDYRLVPDVTFADQFDDVARAVDWTHQHIGQYGGDPDALVLAGHSAGGHITALAAFDDTRLGADARAIKGYAPLSPIVDLQQWAATPPDENARIANEVFGTDLVTDSPSTYFKADVAPVFFALGEHDLDFLQVQVPAAVDQLATLGAPVELHMLPGESHDDVVLRFDTGDDDLTPQLVEFVTRVTQ